jgi:ferrous-iron efflux pump FieF
LSDHHHTHKCTHSHFDFSAIENENLKRWATYAAVSVALILILSKVMAWMLTDSVSVLSSLADSFLDFIASGINMVAVHRAMKPADKNYRFGHGKIEALSAIAQTLLIVISASVVIYEAQEHFSHPQVIEKPLVGIVVMMLSIVLTSGLVMFQNRVIKRTQSVAITADSMHYKADLYLNLGVLVSIVISSWFHFLLIDALVGGIIGIYLLSTCWQIGKEAYSILMDRELPDFKRQRLIEIILAHPKTLAYHDLKTRSSGVKNFIQFHLELEGKLTLFEAHHIIEEIEHAIKHEFSQVEVIIHADPHGVHEERAFEPSQVKKGNLIKRLIKRNKT